MQDVESFALSQEHQDLSGKLETVFLKARETLKVLRQ